MTREPARALAFLGLDEAWYARGFDSVEDMFAFCAGCRFMRRETYRRQGLKANDRKRMRQRPVYNRFVDEWLPDWQGVDDDGGASLMTREQALKEALETFGQKAEFESKVEEWRVERKEYEEKREGREARKARAVEEAEYADAWICAIK